jgi:hypothetical protein
MTDLLARLVVLLNALANLLGRYTLAPLAVLPGWLSATLVAAVTGVLLLVAFKYTSNQRALGRVRADIKAHLLALRLFKDSAAVAVRAQGHILLGAFQLMLLAIVPMLVMALPVCLLLEQLGLWYQSRPLPVGEEAVVTVQLAGDAAAPWPDVRLQPTAAVESAVGPVRMFSQRALCWNVRARQAGYHRLVFVVDGRPVEKEVAVGDGFMRVSARRPAREWSDALLHPAEEPLGPDAPVRSIDIEYPDRPSWTSGTDLWVYYWFGASMVAALCFRPFLNVKL